MRTANEPAYKMRWHWFIAVKKKSVHIVHTCKEEEEEEEIAKKNPVLTSQIHYIILVVK
jgi:hypothetical protein